MAYCAKTIRTALGNLNGFLGLVGVYAASNKSAGFIALFASGFEGDFWVNTQGE
jgi:hypothetical protein